MAARRSVNDIINRHNYDYFVDRTLTFAPRNQGLEAGESGSLSGVQGMGELIHFRAPAGAGRLKPATSDSKSATIIFFTGVRYQRYEQAVLLEPNTGSSPPPRGGVDGAGRGKRKRRG